MFLYNFVKEHNITKRLFITYFTGFAVIIYFLCCTVIGKKGLIEYFTLKNKVEGRELEKEELAAKMRLKENMVEGMNVKSLDIDLLDEEARRVLGYSGKNEVVIYQDKSEIK
ncbi:MAG: septum formation initiator family protein [Rickettsiales bacterium]|nr:septum formation initiator family protein [Rickettsiales bacterium]